MIFSDNIVKAVSWTLVHSLWQGILLAVFAGLIILFTRKSVAALRYNLLSALFVLFLVTVGLTFNYEFTPEGLETITRLNLPIAQEQIDAGINAAATADISGIVIGFLNENANFIAMIWLVVFAFKMLGIFNAFGHIYRVRNYKTFSPSEYWKNRVSELALLVNVRKPIVLLESALIKIPCVTGYFKPIILLPIGLLSNLPQDQVEAILLHELAHIRRKDYAINLLQHLAETVFFFNPGLLWLSALIKDERENCCDDIALEIIGNKTDFVHALISFEEYNNQKLAVAFAGKKHHLLQRVKRIIYDDNKTLDSVEKIFLSVSLIMVAIVVIACANPQMNEGEAIREPKAVTENAQLADENSEIAEEAVVNSPEEFDQESIKADEIDKASQRDSEENEQVPPIYTYGYLAETAVPACKPEPVAGPEPAEVSTTTSVTTRTVTSKTKTSHNQDKDVTTYDSDNPKNNRHSTLRTGISGENLPDDINVDNLTNNIISDLISENIIKNTQGLSYKLSNNSLIVNGVKQCETIHARLKNKYVKSKVTAICYNYEYSGDI
jgi:bla regulator protein blaR1